MKKNTTTKKQNRAALRKRRAKRRFAFLNQLRRDTELSSSAKMVVWSLADNSYNLDDERCNPGFATIGANIGRKRSSTIDAIQEAEAAGWITISSIGGGSKACTNQYTLVWAKKALKPAEAPWQDAGADIAERVAAYDAAYPGQSVRQVAEALGVSKSHVQRARKAGVPLGEYGTAQPVDIADKTSNGTASEDALTNQGVPECEPVYTQYTEIIEENEIEGCGTPHPCPMEGCGGTSVGVRYTTPEPNLNLKEVKEGGKEQPSAACGFAAPLKREEEELAFQQLCQLWQIRDEFWPDIDVAKAREAFAAVSSEFGDQIRRENPGVSFGYYMLVRAQVWIDAFLTAHPDGNGAKYLKRLEIWLGAPPPDGKGNAVPWWQKTPTPKPQGRQRGRKPDLLAVAINGGRHAA
jgi:Helix-turn-helix domain